MPVEEPLAVADVRERAKRTLGSSLPAVYKMVARALAERHRGAGTLVDVGCGTGMLRAYTQDYFDNYIGADVIRYEGFPADSKFVHVDLDSGRVPLPDECAAAVIAVETIEHLENPRAFVRELVRLATPGGLVLVTTPNQLSLLSKMTLLLRNEFNAFRAGSYPAHLTALLEVDLRRIAHECGIQDAEVRYSGSGRIVLTAQHYPWFLSRLMPRAFSDNILAMGRKQ